MPWYRYEEYSFFLALKERLVTLMQIFCSCPARDNMFAGKVVSLISCFVGTKCKACKDSPEFQDTDNSLRHKSVPELNAPLNLCGQRTQL